MKPVCVVQVIVLAGLAALPSRVVAENNVPVNQGGLFQRLSDGAKRVPPSRVQSDSTDRFVPSPDPRGRFFDGTIVVTEEARERLLAPLAEAPLRARRNVNTFHTVLDDLKLDFDLKLQDERPTK